MKNFILFFVLLIPGIAFSQLTITTTGNWSNPSNWTGGDIGDQSTEDVSMNNTIGTTILNSETFTIGDLTANNNNSVTINTGGSLSLSPGSFLAAGNGTTITVSGTFTVNGNFTVQNNITLVVSGTMIVTGNFVAGNNSGITVDGSITIQGSASVGNNSTLNGTGTFYTGGGCTGDIDVCGDSQLPIELVSFEASTSENSVVLHWATAFEQDVSEFVIEKSIDGMDFMDMISIKSKGNSKVRQDYEVRDENPFIGNTYYRLKEIDINGTTETFEIVAAKFSGRKKASVFPNPVTEHQLNFSLNFIPENNAEFSIVDLTSTAIKQGKITAYEMAIPLDVQAGVYFLILKTPDCTSMSRFIVR
jgi:hypothetical protein